MAAKAIHSMIRALDETRSVAFYRKAFGLEIVNRYDFPDFVLVYLANASTPFELELTINKGRVEPYALGDGYGHLALSVDDLDGEHARLTSAGIKPRPIFEFKRDGRPLCAVLLRPGSRRLQDRGAGARRPVRLIGGPSAFQVFVNRRPGKPQPPRGLGDIAAREAMRLCDLLAEPALDRRVAA